MSERTNGKNKAKVSRRDFLAKSALGAGAAAALGTSSATSAAAADAAPNMPAIRVADEFTKSVNEPTVAFEFGGERGLTGAEIALMTV
jgi:hypothetical protein